MDSLLPKVSACVVVWKRQQNVPLIVESLLQYPFISEILIKDNSKTDNNVCWGKYELAQRASNEIIYSQDDDCIVNDIDKLYKEFISDQTRITCGATDGYLNELDNHPYKETNLALIGWGSFWKKEWVSNFDKYFNKYPRDKFLNVYSDRIFTMLMPNKPKVIKLNIIDLSGNDDAAMWRVPGAVSGREEAINRCRSL